MNSSLEVKILNGLERLSETLKALLWEKAKVHGISPIQIQILLFIENHKIELCNVSYLALELNVTKATISDAVRVLLQKGLVQKDHSPTDQRRFNLRMTNLGNDLINNLSDYAGALQEELSSLQDQDLSTLYKTISTLISKLHDRGIIKVQRMCFKCQYYKGDKKKMHFCNFLNSTISNTEIRLDCDDFYELSQ